MKKKLLAGFIIGMLTLGLVAHSEATLTSKDLATPGDGQLTYDSLTGLSWLDLTNTIGYSYDTVLACTGQYTTALGFRYATGSEVAQLLVDAGITEGQSTSWDITNINNTRNLIYLLGVTYTDGHTFLANGYLADPIPGVHAGGYLAVNDIGHYYAQSNVLISSIPNYFESVGAGAFLVKDNLPPVIESSIPVNGSDSAKPIPSVTITFFDAGSVINLAASIAGATVKNSAGQSLPGSWSASGAKSIVFTPSIAFAADTFTVSVQPVDGVGNKSVPLQVVFSSFDKSAPVTTAILSGTKGSEGWHSTPVTVTLSATDGDNGSGVERIEYSLDGMNWINYLTPLVLDNDGMYTLYYRGIDKVGNKEVSAGNKNVALFANGGIAFVTSMFKGTSPGCIGSTPFLTIDGQAVQAFGESCYIDGTWVGANPQNDTWMVRFEGPKMIGSIKWMTWARFNWLDPQSQPKDYYVEYTTDAVPLINSGTWQPVPDLVVTNSDGTVDATKAFVSGNTKGNWLYDAGHAWIIHDFGAIPATALRIRVAAKVAGSSYGPALGEVEVYEAEPLKSTDVKINKNGIVGLWKMDGDWNDASVVGNHATDYGSVFSPIAKIGTSSGSFNGTNSYLEVPNSATLNPSHPGLFCSRTLYVINRHVTLKAGKTPPHRV